MVKLFLLKMKDTSFSIGHNSQIDATKNNTNFKNMQTDSKQKDTRTDGYTVLYAVLKLCQGITYTDPFTREKRKEKIQGIAGYIPCFETIEEAEENACDGKFEIVAIKRA